MANVTWNGGTGDWFTAANWTPAQVPQTGDTATVTSGSIQLTFNPADGITLNLDATGTPNKILDVRNVTFSSHFTIVADGLNNVAITGSVIDQGTISDTKGLSFSAQSSDALFTNQGTVNVVGGFLAANVNFVNSGTITIESKNNNAGSLAISDALTGVGSVSISNGGQIHVQSTGSVSAGQTFIFQDAPTTGLIDDVIIDSISTFAATISGFQKGDLISVGTIADSENYDPSSHLLSLFSGGKAAGSLTIAGPFSYTTASFNLTAAPIPGGGTTIKTDVVPCFCRGTLILTERGNVPVEELAVGDRVKTLSGACKPIVWIGFGRDLVTRSNRLARPIAVRRGALADNVPQRDLYLTHGHALFFDGVLIPVEHLVNHRSIAWDETARVVEYYHLELADHDVLFAEGAPAESYYDAGNRSLFQNMQERSAAGAGKFTCAPVLNSGEIVESVWAELFERGGGYRERSTTNDADLHLVIDGERFDPTVTGGGVYLFELGPVPPRTLRLCSRSGVPSLLGLGCSDHRPLGVAIKRIALQHAGIETCFEYDAPQLREGGCYFPEDGFCWTDGECELPARFFTLLSGAFTLVVHTEPHHDMRYPISARLAHAA